jgi:hypothetical protein
MTASIVRLPKRQVVRKGCEYFDESWMDKAVVATHDLVLYVTHLETEAGEQFIADTVPTSNRHTVGMTEAHAIALFVLDQSGAARI